MYWCTALQRILCLSASQAATVSVSQGCLICHIDVSSSCSPQRLLAMNRDGRLIHVSVAASNMDQLGYQEFPTSILQEDMEIYMQPHKIYTFTRPSSQGETTFTFTVMVKGQDQQRDPVQVAFFWTAETMSMMVCGAAGLVLLNHLPQVTIPLDVVVEKLRSIRSGTAVMLFRSNKGVGRRFLAEYVVKDIPRQGPQYPFLLPQMSSIARSQSWTGSSAYDSSRSDVTSANSRNWPYSGAYSSSIQQHSAHTTSSWWDQWGDPNAHPGWQM